VSAMPRLVAGLRSAPPEQLCGVPVTEDGPAADIVRLRGDGVRVIVRPSGTEPKVKAYLEVVTPVTGSLADARAQATARLATLRDEVTALLEG
jgi:phosphomannomutase